MVRNRYQRVSKILGQFTVLGSYTTRLPLTNDKQLEPLVLLAVQMLELIV